MLQVFQAVPVTPFEFAFKVFSRRKSLTSRLSSYQTEWKRVREFIEQRERDFGRPGCDLDLYGVVAMVEKMYDEVKMDLEASTPDRFAGFSSARKNMQQQIEAPVTRPISFSLPRAKTEDFSEKFLESGFGSRVKDLASDIGHKADLARAAVKDFQDRKEHVSEDASRGVKEYADRAERLETSFGEKVKDLASDIGHRAHLARDAAQDLQAREQHEIEEVGKEAGKEARDHAANFERTASGRFKGPITVTLSGTTATPTVDSKVVEKSPLDTSKG